MPSFLAQLLYIVRLQTGRWLVLLLLMLAGAAFEAIGIGLIVPFVAILNDPDLIFSNARLRFAFELSGSSTATQFFLVCTISLFCVFLVKNVFLGLLTYLVHLFVTQEQVHLGSRLLASYLHRPYAFHLRRNSAQLVNVFSTEINRVYTGVVLPVLVVVSEAFVLLFVVTLLLLIAPVITLITLGLIALAACATYFGFRNLLQLRGRERLRLGATMIQWVTQGLGSIKEAKIAGREDFFVRSFTAASRDHARASRFFAVINALPRLFIEVVAVGGIAVVVLLVLLREDDVGSALPTLALFAMAAIRIVPLLSRLFTALSSIRFYTPSVAPMYRDLVAATADRVDSRNTATPGRNPVVFERMLEVRDILYAYDEVQKPAISGVSLTIPKGISIGLVGPSGSGKSTLVDLILGLLTPQAGQVLVDGVDIRSNLPGWQRALGYVPQAIFLLDDSLRRNIALGIADDEVDEVRMSEAVRLAQLEALVEALPGRLDTVVGENGARLSGGERQRVGIARALYLQPQVLIFDEATSALDNVTEAEIIATIGRLSGTRTVIQVAHRLSTVKECDVIYLIKTGSLVDAGSFEDLMGRSAEFRLLAREASDAAGERPSLPVGQPLP